MHAVPECRSILSRLDAFLAEELTHEEAERVRDHLAGCAACLEEAGRTDPSLLFLTLREREQTEFFWASFWRDLQEELPERRPSGGRRRLVTAAAAVVCIVLVGLLTWIHDGTGIVEETASSPERPAPSAAAEVTSPEAIGPPASRASEILPRVTVRDAGARVVMIDSDLVMVYNPEIDL